MWESAETQWPPIFRHPGNSEFENRSNELISDSMVVSILYKSKNERSWAHKRLFNLQPQFSRLGTQGPASHVLCDFVSVWCLCWCNG